MNLHRSDLARTTLAVLAIGTLMAGSLWVLRPFLGAIVWAALIVVATWPVMVWLQGRLGGRRWLAVGLVSLALLLLFVVPLTLAIASLATHAGAIGERARSLASLDLRVPPPWLAELPRVGPWLAQAWRNLAGEELQTLLSDLAPFGGRVGSWVLGQIGSIGGAMLQFLLTVAIAAVMYLGGESAAQTLLRFGHRLGGRQGEACVALCAQAIRGVAIGVGGTAIVQAVLGGLGLWMAGVPFAGPLTALMLVLEIAQVGPLPVLLGAAGWLFWLDRTGFAVGLLAWSGVVGTLDNVLRPLLIRRGADLPTLLILAGVVGGLLSFGLVGIFVGPVVLAVSWTLFDSWVGTGGGGEAPELPTDPSASLLAASVTRQASDAEPELPPITVLPEEAADDARQPRPEDGASTPPQQRAA